MNASLQQFLDGNRAPPRPLPGEGIVRATSFKVQPAGGALLDYVYHDTIEWFERGYRKLPPDGVYTATPRDPVIITMGVVEVPKSMVFVLMDYYFDIYRFSGLVVGEFVPLENRRLSTQVTWDIVLPSGRRPANLNFQIVPQEPTLSSPAFAPVTTGGALSTGLTPASNFMFEQAQYLNQQTGSGAGLSSLPQRHHREGLMQLNQNYVARPGDTVSVTCTVRSPIPIPIGFFEANVCGILMPQETFARYQLHGKPAPLEEP